MKESVDLTENRAFADYTRNNGVYTKQYKHHRLPWDRGCPEKTASLKKDTFSSGYLSSFDRFTNSIDNVTITFSIDNTWHVLSWEDMTNDMSVTTDPSSMIMTSRDGIISVRLDTSGYYSFKRKYNTNYNFTLNKSDKKSEFPTGRKSEIIENRILYQLNGEIRKKQHKLNVVHECPICKKRFHTFPWKKEKMIDSVSSIMVSIDKPICDTCYHMLNIKQQILDQTKHKRKPTDTILFERWVGGRTSKMCGVNFWRSKHEHFCSVPCLSSDTFDVDSPNHYVKKRCHGIYTIYMKIGIWINTCFVPRKKYYISKAKRRSVVLTHCSQMEEFHKIMISYSIS